MAFFVGFIVMAGMAGEEREGRKWRGLVWIVGEERGRADRWWKAANSIEDGCEMFRLSAMETMNTSCGVDYVE